MVRRSFHSVVEVPIGSHGQALPVLMLQDGEISLYTLAWARNMVVVDDRSPSHVLKSVAATGLLYDFYVGVYNSKPLAANEMPVLMRGFYEARALGNVALGWKPAGKKTAKSDVRYASEFSKFCAANFETYPINPVEKKLIGDLNVSAQMQHYANLDNKKKWDLLFHLLPTTEAGAGTVSQFAFTPNVRVSSPKYCHNYFPPEKVLPLIAATDNLRDRLAFILLFFGGLRISELFHLYTRDITVSNRSAHVKIAHPELAQHSWDDRFRGELVGSRAEFLFDRYSLTARNKLGLTNPLHAGWKGMSYSEGKHIAGLHWLIPEMSELFASQHHRYLREFRTAIPDTHPYYFINLQDSNYGSALKISNLTKSFYRAAQRVGLHPSDQGVNPHGARHFYGHFCASYLRVPIEMAQVYLRHVAISSTQVYYSIDPRNARAELLKGYERLKQDIPPFLKDIIALGSTYNDD